MPVYSLLALSLRTVATRDHRSRLVMLLPLDSLGQCVSALSKRFAAADSIQDSAVHCLSHSHRDKNSEVRHRKDAHHRQEDAAKVRVSGNMATMVETQNLDPDLCLMQINSSKVPTSILKRPSSIYASDAEPSHRRKGERRVRFRDPETTVHGESAAEPVSFCQG